MGKLSTKVKNLLIPRKTQYPVEQPSYGTDARAIEQWAAQVGMYAGTIQEIVAGTGVTVTNGDGPVVTVAASGTGGGYASLTGPGQTATPGNLTQAGGFTVTDSAGSGISLNSTAGLVDISTTSTSTSAMNVSANGSVNVNGGINVNLLGADEVTLEAGGGVGGGPQFVVQSGVGPLNQVVASAENGFASIILISRLFAQATNNARFYVGDVTGSNPIFICDAFGGGTYRVGFFGASVAQQSSTGITTVAQLVTVLKNYGLLS